MKKTTIPRPDMNVRIKTVLFVALVVFVVMYFFGFVGRGFGGGSKYLSFIKRYGDLLTDRGFIPYATVAAFALTISILRKKYVLVNRQLLFCQDESIPDDFNFQDHDAVSTYIDSSRAKQDFEENMLATRVARLLETWLTTGHPERIADMAVEEAEFDYSVRDDGHRLLLTLLWSIPILGFVGTVMGIGGAVGGFTKVMEAADELEKLKEGIQAVTSELAVAFDTTFLALVLALISTFAHTVLKSREDAVIEKIDTFVEDGLVSKLVVEHDEKIVRWLTKEEERQAIQEAVVQHIPRPEDYTAAFGGVIREAAQEVSSVAKESAQAFRQEGEGLRRLVTDASQEQRNITATFAQGLLDQMKSSLRGFAELQQKVVAASENIRTIIVETGEQQRAETNTFAQSLRSQLEASLRETNTMQQQIVSASQGLPALIRETAEQQRAQTNTFVQKLRDEMQASLQQITTVYGKATAEASESMRTAIREAGEMQRAETNAFNKGLQDQMRTSVAEVGAAFEQGTVSAVEAVGNALRGAAEQQRAETESFVKGLQAPLREALGAITQMQESLSAASETMRAVIQETTSQQRAQADNFVQSLQQRLESSARELAAAQEKFSAAATSIASSIRDTGEQQRTAITGLVGGLKEESERSLRQVTELREAQRGAAEEMVRAMRAGQESMEQSMRSHLESVTRALQAEQQRFGETEQRLKAFFDGIDRSVRTLEQEERRRLDEAGTASRQASEWLQKAQALFQQTYDGLLAQMREGQQFIAVLNNLSQSEAALAERLQRLQGDRAFRESIDRFVAAQSQGPGGKPSRGRRFWSFGRK
ncbi:MAG: MotA/TolQ/ExbB proton channel family protein [Kiritimatiellae bacterium]|nr:MotA/TolQ/ExbB proton channel family protein [Kiritimatiellia bacterium]